MFIRFPDVTRQAIETGKRTRRTSLSRFLSDPLKETEPLKIPLGDASSYPAGWTGETAAP